MIDYQRAWAEINLDNIAHNTRQIKNFIGNNTDILAIVKAEAYGHGLIETSKVIVNSGATSLGVATYEEGITLRNNGISVDILILGYTPKQRLVDVINNNLIQTVFNKDMARDISKESKKLNKTAQIHIKIDTGMSRLGFKSNHTTIEDVLYISKLPNISITGIYTHLAMSESSDKSFTYEQYHQFQYITNRLKEEGLSNFKEHICNSGGILNNIDLHMDLVRPGLILYGLSPSLEVDTSKLNLKPALSLKTRISNLKTLSKGVSVGYDRTFFTKRETIVATVPIGYADGYPRALSNKGKVIIGNSYAPIIGNVCMDQMMIDVTDIKDIKMDDEVLLIGKKGDMEISADKIAELVGSISREVMCNIGKRVPRVYIKNNTIFKIINL